MIEDSLFGDIPAYQQLRGVVPANQSTGMEPRQGNSASLDALPDDFDKMLETPLTGEEVAQKMGMLAEQGLEVGKDTISRDEFLAYHEWHKNQSSQFWSMLGDAAAMAGSELYGGTLAIATDWKKLAAATGLSLAASPLVGIGAVYGQTIAEGAGRGTRDLVGLFKMAANHPGSPLYRLFINPNENPDQLYQDFLDLADWNNQTMKYISGKEQMLMPEKATYEKVLGKSIGGNLYDFVGVNHEIATAASYFLDPTLLLSFGGGKAAAKAGAAALAAGAPGKGVQAAAAGAATRAGFVSSALSQGSDALAAAGTRFGSSIDRVTAGALTKGGQAVSKLGYMVSRPIDVAYGFMQRRLEDVFGKVVNHTAGRFGVRRAKPDTVASQAPQTLAHAMLLTGGGNLLLNVPYGGAVAMAWAAAHGLQLGGRTASKIGRGMAGGSKTFLQAAADMNAAASRTNGGGSAVTAAIEKAGAFTEYFKMLGVASAKGSAYGAVLGGLSTGEEGLASGIGAGAVIGSYAHNLGYGYGMVSGAFNKQKLQGEFTNHIKTLRDNGLILQADRIMEFLDTQSKEHGEEHANRVMGQILAASKAKDTVVSYINPLDAIEAISNDSTLWVKNDDGTYQTGPDGKPVLNSAGQALFNLAADTTGGKASWNGMFIHENPDGTKRERPWAMWSDSRTGKRHIIINIDGFTYQRDEGGNILTVDKIVPTGRKVETREAEMQTVEGPRPTVDETTTSTRQDVGFEGMSKPTPEGNLNARLAMARARARTGVAWEEISHNLTVEKFRKLSKEKKMVVAQSVGIAIDSPRAMELVESLIKENEALVAERNGLDSKGRDAWDERLKEKFKKFKKLDDELRDITNIEDAEKRIDALEALEKEYGKDIVSDAMTSWGLERKPIESTSTRTVELQGPGRPVERLERGAFEGQRPEATVKRERVVVKEEEGTVLSESGIEATGRLRKKVVKDETREVPKGTPGSKTVELQGPGRPMVREQTGTTIGVKKFAKTESAKDAVLEELFHLYNAIGRDQKIKTSVDAVREWLIGDGTAKGLLETQPKNVVELLRKVVEKEGLAKTVEQKIAYEQLFKDMEQGKIDYDNVNKFDVMFEELGAKMFIGWVDGKPFDYIYRHGDLGLFRNGIEILKDKYAQQFQRTASQLGADIRTEQYVANWFKKNGNKQHKFDKTVTDAFKDMLRLYKSEGMKEAGNYEFKYRHLPPAKQVQWAEENGLEHWVKRNDAGEAIGLKTQQEINASQHASMHRAVSELFQLAETDESVLDGLDFYLIEGDNGQFPASQIAQQLDGVGMASLQNSAFDTVAGNLANNGKILFQSPDFSGLGDGIGDIQTAQAGSPATGKVPAETRYGARGRPRTTPTGKMLKEMREMIARSGPKGSFLVFRGVPNAKAFDIISKHIPKAMSENIRRMTMAVYDGGKNSNNLFSGVYHGFEHTDAQGNKHLRANGDVWKPRNVSFVPYEMEFAVNLRNPKTANYDYSRPHMYARVRTIDMDVLDRRINMLWEEDFEAMQRLYDSKDSFTAHVYKTLTEYSSTDLIPAKDFFGRDDEAWERRQYTMAAIGAFPNRTQNAANNGTIGTIDQPYHRFLSRKDESFAAGYNNPWTSLHLGNFKGLVEEGPSKAKFIFTEKAYYRSMVPTPAGPDKPGQPSRFNVSGTTRPIMYQAEEPIPAMMMNPVEFLDGQGVDISKYKSEQKLIADATKLVSDPMKLLKEIKKTPWLNKPKQELFPAFQAADTYGAKDLKDGEFLRGNFEYAHEQLGDIFQSEAVKRFILDTAGPEAMVIKHTLEEHMASVGKRMDEDYEAMSDYFSMFQTGKPTVVVGNHGTKSFQFAYDNNAKFDESKAGENTQAASARLAWWHAGSSKTSAFYTNQTLNEKYIRSIVAFKNPYVHNYQGKSYSEIKAESNYSNSITSIINKAKLNGHDGVIFVGLRDPDVLDVHYATPVELGNKNIIRIESSFKTSRGGPYRRGLNGMEGAGERFQSADQLPEGEKPERRSPRKSVDEVLDDSQYDATKSVTAEVRDLEGEERAAARRTNDEEGDEYGEESQRYDIESKIESETEMSEIMDIDELKRYAKRTKQELATVYEKRLETIDEEIDAATKSNEEGSAAALQDLKDEIESVIEKINKQEERSKSMEMQTLADDTRKTYSEFIKIAELVKGLRAAGEAQPVINFKVNQLLKEINKDRKNNPLSWMAVQDAKIRIGGRTFTYMDINPELIEARVSEILGSVPPVAIIKNAEAPKTVTEVSAPKDSADKATPQAVENSIKEKNKKLTIEEVRELPRDAKDEMLLRRVLTDFWEENGWDTAQIDRMRGEDLPGAKAVMDELKQVDMRAFDMLHDKEFKIHSSKLTQETIDALAERLVRTDSEGNISASLRELMEVQAEYDFNSTDWVSGIEDSPTNRNVYLDILNGVLPRGGRKSGPMKKLFKDKARRTSIAWESLQTDKKKTEKIIKDFKKLTDKSGESKIVPVFAEDALGDVSGADKTMWQSLLNEAAAAIKAESEVKVPELVPDLSKTVRTKNWDKVKTREQAAEEAKKLTPTERYEFLRDYVNKVRLGVLRLEPEITEQTVYREMTAEDVLREQQEFEAWELETIERFNLGVDVYNSAMIAQGDPLRSSPENQLKKLNGVEDFRKFLKNKSYTAKFKWDRIFKLISLGENITEVDLQAVEKLQYINEAKALAKSAGTDYEKPGMNEMMNNLFIVNMLGKWEEDLRSILSNENHPDHTRLVSMLDALEKSGELKPDNNTIGKTEDGDWFITSLFKDVEDIQLKKRRDVGFETGRERTSVNITHEPTIPFELIAAIMGDAAKKDLRFFYGAMEASRDHDAAEKFKVLYENVPENAEARKILEKYLEWERLQDLPEYERELKNAEKRQKENDKSPALSDRIAFERDELAKKFNGRNSRQIKAGLTPRTGDTITDAELVGLQFLYNKMKFNVWNVEGNEVISVNKPKGAKHVRSILPKELTREQIEQAYTAAVEELKPYLKDADAFSLASETNMTAVELALSPKVEKSGASTRMTPAEKKAIKRVAGTQRVTDDGTTVDGQYSVDNRPNVGNKPSLRVVQVQSETNPHTGVPQPEKVVAIVNTPEQAQAAIIKHEEQVREVVETITGEATKNPLDAATAEIPKQVVDQIIEEAKVLDSELEKRPLPVDADGPAEAPVAAAPKPEEVAPAQPTAPKLPPNLSGSPASSAARRVVGILRLDSSKPEHRNKWVNGFMKARNSQKFGIAVDPKTADEVTGYRLIMTDNEGAFAYVSPDGEIGGVARSKDGTKADVDAVMNAAIKAGGKWLTAYDTILPDLYAQKGFTAVARVKFDIRYNPDFPTQLFEKFNRGQPDVIAMAYTGTAAAYESVKADLPVVDYDKAILIAMEKSGMKKADAKPVETKPKMFPPEKHPYFGDAVTLLMAAGMPKQLAIRLAKDAIKNDMEVPVQEVIKRAMVLKQALAESVKKQEERRQSRQPAVREQKQPQKPKTVILPREPKVEPKPVSAPVAPAVQRPVQPQRQVQPQPVPARPATPPPSMPQGTPAPRAVAKTPTNAKAGLTLDEATAIMLTEFDTYKTAYKHGNYSRQGTTYVNGSGYVVQQIGLSKFRVFNPGKVNIGDAEDEQDAVDLIIKEYYGIK